MTNIGTPPGGLDGARLPRVGSVEEDAVPQDSDLSYWSVTTVIDNSLPRKALETWAVQETAKAAVEREAAWKSRLANEGRESAVKYLCSARFERHGDRRTATELGNACHEAFCAYALDGTRPDVDAEVAPFLVQWERFCQAFQPEFLATETTVYFDDEPGDPSGMRYAGTLDALVRIDGQTLLLDYKTSREDFDGSGKLKRPYPEVGLQLAAYRFADMAAVWRARRAKKYGRRYYLLNDTERALAVPMPSADGGVAVLITPTRYAAHPVKCSIEVFGTFLHAWEVARWTIDSNRAVVGNELMPHVPAPDLGDPFAGLPQE